MKISFVTANLGAGGAERVISLLANEFDKHGYDVEILFLKERIVFYPVHQSIKVVVAEEECHSQSMWKKMLWLRKHVSKTKPDVVIPFRVSVYTTTLLSLLGLSVPVISSERIDPHVPDPLWDILRRLLLPFTTHLVVQTSYIKSYYPMFIQKKTSVILNPVDEKVFKTIDNGLLKMDNRQNRIISVARLAPQKNQEMMIRAFAELASDYPDWQLVIYGEGPRRQSLQLTIDNLQLTDRVLLPGKTEQVIDELQKSKVFCFSSDYEGLSNAMIEAFCVGLPIVTTCVSGTEDMLVNGENGYIIPINDQVAMAQSLSALLKDEQLRSEMGERNRNKAKMFSIEGIYSQWESLINSIVKNGN